MPIITMLESNAGLERRRRPLVVSVVRRSELTHDLVGREVATSGWVPVWQKLQVSVQPTCSTRRRAAILFRNV